MDNIRGRLDTLYEDMLKHEDFATAQKLKLAFLGVGVMEDSLLKVFKKNNEDIGRMVAKGECSQGCGDLDLWDVYAQVNRSIREGSRPMEI